MWFPPFCFVYIIKGGPSNQSHLSCINYCLNAITECPWVCATELYEYLWCEFSLFYPTQTCFFPCCKPSNQKISLFRITCFTVPKYGIPTKFTSFERIQHRATKYILNDFSSNYKTRLVNLILLPLMYQLDLYDILFFVKSFQNPTASFNIRYMLTFASSPLNPPLITNCNMYFLPPTNKVISISIDSQEYITLYQPWTWTNHSLESNHLSWDFSGVTSQKINFDDPHTFHFYCPCSICSKHPCTPNFSSSNICIV